MGKKEFCSNCKFWGPECFFDENSKTAHALCHGPGGWNYTTQDHTCPDWVKRHGQPLGTGIFPLWFQPPEHDWKAAASIVHDFRYDHLPSGMTIAGADMEWYKNCTFLAGDNIKRQWIACVGLAIIRTYSILKFRKKKRNVTVH